MNASRIVRVVAALASVAITFFVCQSVADLAGTEQAAASVVQIAQAASGSAIR